MPWCHIQVLIYLLPLTLGACGPRYQPGQPWFCIKTILFHPSMSPLSDFPSHSSLQRSIAQMRLPFWVEPLLNVMNFGNLPTTWEVTLGQEILHCGSGICLGNCVSAPSTDMTSSLPTQHNQSPIKPCSDVATSHPIFTLEPDNISMDHNVLHIFSMSSFSNKVFFSSGFLLPLALW